MFVTASLMDPAGQPIMEEFVDNGAASSLPDISSLDNEIIPNDLDSIPLPQ